jgi:predicted GIY-YIG superfamily endonuclease
MALPSLVYNVPCNDGEGNYVGETRQLLENRIAQHEKDVKVKRTSTALSEHATNMDHFFNFNE